MPKRFRDTQIWRKKWIRELTPDLKLFWFYLLDNCDHAGIWEVDIDLAAFQIGVKLNEEEILNTFKNKIYPFKDGKWFISKFVDYQYGELNENVNAHKSVIKILKKYKLNTNIQPLPRGSITVKKNKSTVLYMDKDMDKVQDKRDTKKIQLDKLKNDLKSYEKEYPNLNIKFYYESFVDYLDANDKRYKNYLAAFKNCCRSEWYKEKPGSTKDIKNIKQIILKCPDGHYERLTDNRGTYATCPQCRAKLVENF